MLYVLFSTFMERPATAEGSNNQTNAPPVHAHRIRTTNNQTRNRQQMPANNAEASSRTQWRGGRTTVTQQVTAAQAV